MPNITDWKPGQRIQAVVIGKSKSGKTWGAGSWPRPVFLDFDDGIATLAQPAWRARFGSRSVEYQTFREATRSSKGVVTQHNAFDDACRYFDEKMKPDKRDTFDTWVVDSGTTLTQAAMNKSVILLGTKQLSSTSSTLDKAMKSGVVLPVLQDYGATKSMIEQFIRLLKDSDKHVLILCHEHERMDEGGTIIGIGPMLTGQSREIVPLMFDEVWFLRVMKEGANTVRYLQTQPDGLRQCGSRYGIPDRTPYEYDAVIKSITSSKEK